MNNKGKSAMKMLKLLLIALVVTLGARVANAKDLPSMSHDGLQLLPDTNSPGMTRTFAASAGQMTLYMELFDGKTGDIIARVIDTQAAGDGGFVQWRNRITNKADARRIMQRWAKLLNNHLAHIKSLSAN